MKPLGPIPEGYASIDGELAIAGKRVSELVAEAGSTPAFIYSGEMVRGQIDRLRNAMPERLGIHYAVKANPFQPLVDQLQSWVDGFDVASGNELKLLLELGIRPETISFAGPGKRDWELETAIEAGATLNCESENEVYRALRIAEQLGKTPCLAIRVNPDFELRGSGMKMGGGAKPFGLDTERVPALTKEVISAGAKWQGFHIYSGSQALDSEAIIETLGKVLDLAAQMASEAGAPLPRLNMGGGFGIPYFHGDVPLNVQNIGDALKERFSTLPKAIEKTEFCIELGRYIVGEAGVYLARIIDRKISHGHIFLVTDGGLHHQLAASGNFGTVVRRNYPVAIASRFDADPEEEASVVGCLCTPLDRLADNAALPRADIGDIVAVFCAGAYGASASPAAFLGQGPAYELLV